MCRSFSFITPRSARIPTSGITSCRTNGCARRVSKRAGVLMSEFRNLSKPIGLSRWEDTAMPDVILARKENALKPSKKLQCDIIRAKSPLRISFTGGGTDVPAWYEQHPGAVLSSTINRYAYVTLYPR